MEYVEELPADTESRVYHRTLADALRVRHVPLENLSIVREILAGVDYGDIYTIPSNSYIGFMMADGSRNAAQLYPGTLGFRHPDGTWEWKHLPARKASGHGSPGSASPTAKVCDRCFNEMPLSGLCDACD